MRFFYSPLELELAVDAPSALEVQEGLYVPMPFTVTATITNTGAVAATNAMVSITLPISLTLEAGQNPTQPIGDLGPGQSPVVAWSVRAITQTRDITLTYTVEAWAENAEAVAEAKEIFIPGIASLGTLSLEQTCPLTNTGAVMTSTLPSDLALVTGGYRAASGVLGDVSAGQGFLPPSCTAYYAQGYRTDGIYTIEPGYYLLTVYCDMTNGGWTVIDPNRDSDWAYYFYGWNSYANGLIYGKGVSCSSWRDWFGLASEDTKFATSPDCQNIGHKIRCTECRGISTVADGGTGIVILMERATTVGITWGVPVWLEHAHGLSVARMVVTVIHAVGIGGIVPPVLELMAPIALLTCCRGRSWP
jgi:hypothetical protein